jgi:hypothetical protein
MKEGDLSSDVVGVACIFAHNAKSSFAEAIIEAHSSDKKNDLVFSLLKCLLEQCVKMGLKGLKIKNQNRGKGFIDSYNALDDSKYLVTENKLKQTCIEISDYSETGNKLLSWVKKLKNSLKIAS